MRLAVIGSGTVGENHLDVAANIEGLEPVAVVDIDAERAAGMASRHGIRAYTDYKEMLALEKPDIAVVALPHFLHKEAAVRCAEQGCHILLEKPMALNTVECDEIIAAAQSHRVKLMVGHTQHYNERNIAAKRIIESGELGQLVMINDMRHVNYYRPDRPAWFFEKAKAGGGIITNLGAHSIDKIQWMTGSRVTKVKASLSFHGDRGDVEGSGLIFLATSKGISATISQSGYPGVSKNETEFIFTRGMLRLETNKARGVPETNSGLFISRGGKYEQVEVENMGKPLAMQFRDLMEAIVNDTEPECSGAYVKTVIAALEGVYRSHETGTEQIVGEQRNKTFIRGVNK